MTEEQAVLMKEAQALELMEFEKRVELIKEIKALEAKAIEDRESRQRGEKVDLTTTTNIGLFSEMSIVELKERLNCLKEFEAEENERKRLEICKTRENQTIVLKQRQEDLEKWKAIERQQMRLETLKEKQFEDQCKVSLDQDSQIRNLRTELNNLRQGKLRVSLCDNPNDYILLTRD